HVQNLLPRYPITLRKHRPQALVPLDNVPKRSFQRPNIQITTQPNRQRDRVPRTTTFQPLQKPQPTLRKRQRNFRRTLNSPQPLHPQVAQQATPPSALQTGCGSIPQLQGSTASG